MPAPKFNFVPERQIGKESSYGSYRVSIFKNGTIYFKEDVINVYELDGKYMKLFADVDKKIIGWSIIENKTDLSELNEARLMKKNVNGVITITIGKLLKKLGIDKKESFPNLEVKRYKSPLLAHDIFYVELNKQTND